MLKVLIFSFVTSCAAYTTHRYHADDYYGNYRPVVPFLDNMFAVGNSNGRQPVQVYEYPKQYDGVVKLSDSEFNQGSVFNSEDINRRAEAQYNQYPSQKRHGEDTSNRAVSEPTQLYNTFESNLDSRYQNHNTDTYDRRQDGQQKRAITQTNGTNKLNETQGNGNITQISIQSDDVNHRLVITEQPIKRNQSSTDDNANINTSRNINSNSNTNSIRLYTKDKTVRFNGNSMNSSNISNKTSKQNPVKNHPTKTYNNRIVNNTKTNKFSVNTNNNAVNSNIIDGNTLNISVNVINNNKTVYNNTKYGSKTTQDNEVTHRTHEGRTDKDSDADRWIWSNSDDKEVETTTLLDLDDRAAFTGNGCPDGKVKVGNTCVTPD